MRVIWLGLLALIFCGCPDRAQFGLGQNQGNTDDDDDNDDNGSGDDDDDDDSADAPPGDWAYYTVNLTFMTTGGVDGGDALVFVGITYYDEGLEWICGSTFTMEADYSYGQDQGAELFEFSDEILTWTGGEKTSSDCPADYDMTATELMDFWEWKLHPMIFVSCDSVLGDAELAELRVTESEFIWQGELGDGDFEFFCETIGPAATYFYQTGEHEGLWMVPSVAGALDSAAEAALTYFEPEDSSNVPTWVFTGFAVAGLENKFEPLEGLEGGYEMVSLWPTLYTR